MTSQDDQHACAAVLVWLLLRDLPPLHWHLSSLRPCLEGHAWRPAGREPEQRAAVLAWADLLGAEMRQAERGQYTVLDARGRYLGVDVRVWAHVSKPADRPDTTGGPSMRAEAS